MKTLISLMTILLLSSAQAQLTTWYQRTTPTDHQLNCVDFPSENIGYIGGNDTLLLKTTDGGDNWTSIDFQGVTVFGGGEHITAIQFLNDTVGYMVVGPYGGTYKTTDGGFNWTLQTVTGNFCYVDALHFFNETDGVLGGSGCFEGELIQLINAGSSSLANAESGFGGGPNSMITDFDFLNGSLGLATSADSRIYRTTDGGANWDTIPVPVSTPLTSVKFIDDTLVYAGYDDLGGSFGLLVSTDAGASWGMDGNSATFYYPAFHEIIETNSDQIYVGAAAQFEPGLIMEYNGQWWNYYNVDQPIFGMDTYSDSVVWAVGDSGYVVTNFQAGSVGLGASKKQIEFNVYPNPCQDAIAINLSGYDNDVDELLIFDMNGQERLKLNGSSIQQSIDVSALSAGMYMICLRSKNGVSTERFIKN